MIFSVPSFCNNANDTMVTSHRFNQLDLGEGTTLTISILRTRNEASTYDTTPKKSTTMSGSKLQLPTPLMNMELAHIIMDHRSLRSLMNGSLHQV
eukprot:3748098-Ditylum_brightwellii.AAC.1